MSIYLFSDLQKYNALDLRVESHVLNSDERRSARDFMLAGLLDESKDFAELNVHFVCPPGHNVATAITTLVLLDVDLTNVIVVSDEAIDISATPAVKVMTYEAFSQLNKDVAQSAEDVQFQRMLDKSGQAPAKPVADVLEWHSDEGGSDHV